MKRFLINTVIKLLALLPLSAIRWIGAIVGRVSLRLSKRSANRLRNNLLVTKLANESNIDEMTRKTAEALGMTLTEAALIAWQKNPKYINSLFEVDDSFYEVKKRIEAGENILFLTPHIGNFETAIKYFSYNLPTKISILYKPSKDPILDEIMLNGRTDQNIIPVPTNRKGVLQLIKHLRNGNAVGILPDNVASGGDGEWVKFFGQDVYATSLSAKIYQTHNASTVLVQSKRTPTGFTAHCVFFKPSSNETQGIMQELYKEIEKLIIEAPEQYYWSYDRFRNVDGAKPKPNERSAC
jgi:KDO2-lipid IV(A) lauroyltransferase